MINKMLGKLDGADVWMVLSLLIFVLFFIGVCIYLLRLSNEHAEKMKRIPFSDEPENQV
jgi:cytochrome c oxidase cbb3-type subunit IV